MIDDEEESLWEHVVFFILVISATVGGIWVSIELLLWAAR